MYLELQKQLGERIRAVLKEKYDLDFPNIPLEIPPDLKFGEVSTPIALQLARALRKAPKIIATEIVAALGSTDGFASFEVAGAGYINARLDRGFAVRNFAEARKEGPTAGGHVLVEHTSINPNKAAHIGHLRNAILGDTFVRILRAAGAKVDVQNYIDNTGVQVADVVVGFEHLEGKSLADVKALIASCEERGKTDVSAAFDYYCWDLYAKTSQWYTSGTDEENAEREKLRYATLHKLEEGGNSTSAMAEAISTAVLKRHLETMERLSIEYDFLPRESEILHLRFWDAAFELLKKTGDLYCEENGNNKGCWVMTRPGDEAKAAEAEGPNEDAKVIVRSNGTVTYVGKDIAYHLWKFGLLGKDFGYKKFFRYPSHECWISTIQGEPTHPNFGGANAIYNVIDSRQSDPQSNVIQALRGMGHVEQADRYTHFGYEMVALTPRCALDLGYEVSEEDQKKSYIEVSGRKGFGVKADDLIDKLIAAELEEVTSRHEELDAETKQTIARQIAIGALRYFMLKYTRNSVIAFDFRDALSFEGETGPYIQYAVVRIRNIFRKGNTTPEAVLDEFAKLASQHASESASLQVSEASRQGTTSVVPSLSDKREGALAPAGNIASFLAGDGNADIWSLWLAAGRRTQILEQAINTSEPSFVAKHAFQLAQEFANFYHNHHILTEADPARKTFLLATAAITLRELVLALSWLGIESPEAM
ncbi:MAG: arginine--tRNA ligase [Terracidiphilus sp.]|nr:arginine--tRNA ligase [Terracidiphilus sp.]